MPETGTVEDTRDGQPNLENMPDPEVKLVRKKVEYAPENKVNMRWGKCPNTIEVMSNEDIDGDEIISLLKSIIAGENNGQWKLPSGQVVSLGVQGNPVYNHYLNKG